MRPVEVEGDSIDDAIRKALIELGVTRDRASIDILNDAIRGILGFGGRKARVRASIRPPLSELIAAIEDVATRRVSRETTKAAAPADNRTSPTKESVRSTPPARAHNPRPEASLEMRGRDQRGSAPNIANASAATPAASQVGSGELGGRSRAVLLELLSHFGVRCEVVCEPTNEAGLVNLSVRGDSSALLIGKHGQTLDAIEYLLNLIVIREPGPTARIEIDVEGYRARREESLVAAARRMAEKVRETGRPATVDLMNPRDRRIVHMALKDESGVTSRSQGEGFLRKLIILPAGKRRNAPRSARDGE